MRIWVAILILVTTNAFAQVHTVSGDILYSQPAKLPADSMYYTLPPYEYWDQQKWRDSVYQFPTFQEGRFEFANGFSPSTRLMLNYNSFLEGMDILIDNKIGALEKFPELKVVWIGSHKFVYTSSFGYLEVVLEGKITLTRKVAMETVYEFSDGFLMSIPYVDDPRANSHKSIRHYWPVDHYYILDPSRRAHRPGPWLMPTLIPDARYKIQDFATLNHIDYKKREDLEKLVTFCNDNYIQPSGRFFLPPTLDLKHSLWKDSLYRFDEFKDATLTFLDGSKEEVKVNYNLETGWLDVVNKRQDTVALSTTSRLLYANIDGTTFMNHPVQGLVEILMQGKVSVGVMRRIVYEGLYNENEKWYRVDNTHFVIKDERIMLPTVRVFHSLFPAHKKEVDWYLNAHNVNLRSKEDLMNLLSYCSRF